MQEQTTNNFNSQSPIAPAIILIVSVIVVFQAIHSLAKPWIAYGKQQYVDFMSEIRTTAESEATEQVRESVEPEAATETTQQVKTQVDAIVSDASEEVVQEVVVANEPKTAPVKSGKKVKSGFKVNRSEVTA